MQFPIETALIYSLIGGELLYLIAPGSIVTSAAAIVLEALKVLLSTILTVPPGFCIAGTSENLNVYGMGVSFGTTMSSFGSSGGGIAIKLDRRKDWNQIAM